MSPRATGLLAAVATLALAACATPREPSAAAASEAPDHLSRFVLAPLNVAVRAPAELNGEFGPVLDGLLGYFHAHDRSAKLLSPIRAERLWLESTLDLEDMPDRSAALEIATARFARRVAEQNDYDLLVVPSVVLRPARMRGLHASWDGVRRLVPNGSDVVNSAAADYASLPANMATVTGLRGKVAAASLHVAIYRPDGSLWYEGLGGLDLIQEAQRDGRDGKWIFGLREAPFANVEHLREGVEAAFERSVRKGARWQ